MSHSPTVSTSPRNSTQVRRWRAIEIAEYAGVSRAKLNGGMLAELERDGVLNRRGKLLFGRPADLDAWLLGTWKGQP